MNTNGERQNPTVPFAFSLMKGPKPEAAVSNELFLDNYIRYGGWLRVITAESQFKILKDKGNTHLDHIAATACFYEQLGLLYEDVVGTLVAWAVWSADDSLLLADLHNKIWLRREQTGNAVIHHVIDRISAGKRRVTVCPIDIVNELIALEDAELLSTIGIPWSSSSVKASVPKEYRSSWDSLPIIARSVVDLLSGRGGSVITAYFNKIKHGPQIVVQDVKDIALGQRGFDVKHKSKLPHGQYLRVLSDGARTQETTDEQQSPVKVAPFLIHDDYVIDKILFESMLVLGNGMNHLANWLKFVQFDNATPTPSSPTIRQLLGRAQSRGDTSQ